MKLRFDNLERRSKVFALYYEMCERASFYRRWRGPMAGPIAVSADPYARKWQQIQMRIAIMETYLRGEVAPNWYNAHWLSKEEASRRNESYWYPLLCVTGMRAHQCVCRRLQYSTRVTANQKALQRGKHGTVGKTI